MMINSIVISGLILQDLELDHTICNEKFYRTKIAIERQSEIVDEIPLLVPGCLENREKLSQNKIVLLCGEIRTSPLKRHERKILKIYILVTKIYEVKRIDLPDENLVTLEGEISNMPKSRETTLGKEICDFCLIVRRDEVRSSYIPCIAWNEIAKRVGKMNPGTRVFLKGRIQSRKYNTEMIKAKEAYEVSTQYIIELK